MKYTRKKFVNFVIRRNGVVLRIDKTHKITQDKGKRSTRRGGKKEKRRRRKEREEEKET